MVLLHRAARQEQSGNLASAETLYRQVWRQQIWNTEVARSLVNTALRRHRWDTAKRDIELFQGANKESAYALFLWGEYHRARGETRDARRMFRKAIERAPDNIDFHLAALHVAANEAEKRQVATEMLDLCPNDVNALLQYSVVMARAGDYAGAIDILHRIKPADRPTIFILYELCCLLLQQQPETMKTVMDKWAGPLRADGGWGMATGLLAYAERRYLDATKAFAAVTPDMDWYGWARSFQITACLHTERWGEAKKLAERMLHDYPGEYPYYLVCLADIALATGDRVTTERLVEKHAAYESDSYSQLALRCYLALDAGDTERGLQYLAYLRTIGPVNANHLANYYGFSQTFTKKFLAMIEAAEGAWNPAQ